MEKVLIEMPFIPNIRVGRSDKRNISLVVSIQRPLYFIKLWTVWTYNDPCDVPAYSVFFIQGKISIFIKKFHSMTVFICTTMDHRKSVKGVGLSVGEVRCWFGGGRRNTFLGYKLQLGSVHFWNRYITELWRN